MKKVDSCSFLTIVIPYGHVWWDKIYRIVIDRSSFESFALLRPLSLVTCMRKCALVGHVEVVMATYKQHKMYAFRR